jgi:hypothetical protein
MRGGEKLKKKARRFRRLRHVRPMSEFAVE